MKTNQWASVVLTLTCAMSLAWHEAQAFYNPSAGRWLSRDPVAEQGGLNVTGFVENNPVSGVDALGQWAYFQPSSWFDGREYNPGDVENFNGQLAQSILDGIIPFADPFGDNGGYDKCDRLLAIGRNLGEFSRNAYLMRVNFGLGEWAAAGTGLGRSAVGLTVNGVNLGLSAESIGTGAGKLSAGDGWGAVDLGLGLLGVKPSISGVMRNGAKFAPQTWGLAGAGRTAGQQVYRFATRGDPSTLQSNLSKAGLFTRLRVNAMMNIPAYRNWSARQHMMGNTKNSPFVSVLEDVRAGAATSDPWLKTIITGKPGVRGVSKAPDLGSFSVPRERLYYPDAGMTLQLRETERLFLGDDLATFLKSWQRNPF